VTSPVASRSLAIHLPSLMRPFDRLRLGGSRWAYGLACAPSLLLVAALVWGTYREMRGLGSSVLRTEIGHLRSHAARRAGGLEILVDSLTAGQPQWNALRQSPALREFWVNPAGTEHSLYAAVVDEAGYIVLHSDAQRVGQRLSGGWYERRVPEAGNDIVLLGGGPLAGEATAYDLRVALHADGRRIGEYHEGVDAQWIAVAAGQAQRDFLMNRSWVLALAALVSAASVTALLYLARRQRAIGLRLHRQARARARELAQIGGGLAHEVRNPLHALRINLHTLRRALGGRGSLSDEQLLSTIEESDAAIDRLDTLMHDLLQFTDPGAGETAHLEVSHEIRAVVNLLGDELRRSEIEVQAAFPDVSLLVSIDAGRLRQMLVNVLTFAQHRAGKQGKIAIEVAHAEEGVQVDVTDSGPPLAAEQLSHLFEPFQAPAETGSGLGLALVQVYAEATGGHVTLERTGPSGNRLRIWLPRAPSTSGVSL
jgi:signal transduction histidine kinase